MAVGVPRPAELRVLEVVVLEVGDGMGHVVLAADELGLPQHLAGPQDAALAGDVAGQIADQEFGPERTRPELGWAR
jgi:hypothetical protein